MEGVVSDKPEDLAIGENSVADMVQKYKRDQISYEELMDFLASGPAETNGEDDTGDSYSDWTMNQGEQGRHAPAVAEDEAEMQTAGTVGRDMADSEFDMNQPNLDETAPPGMEDLVMKLKKEYPGDESKAFATAWSIYNKKHGKVDEDAEWESVVSKVRKSVEELMSQGMSLHDAINQVYNTTTSDYEITALDQVMHDMSDNSKVDENNTGSPEITDDMVKDAYARREEAFANFAPNRYQLADYARSLANQYAQQQSIKAHGKGFDSMSGDLLPEDYDLNNGYGSEEYANGNDYFPNGADSPVVSKTGPSGARQGDNPEQKKMQVAEVHKELVYGYRKYLNETSKLNKKN